MRSDRRSLRAACRVPRPGSIAGMRYKLLGFAVWKGARWYLNRRISSLMPSRKVTSMLIVAGAVGVLAVVANRTDHD